MTQQTDFYSLLHVQPDAPAAVIKASYRAMMQKLRYHPDLGGDEVMAQLLNEAVDTLCDSSKRSRYDRERLLCLLAEKKRQTSRAEAAAAHEAAGRSSSAGANRNNKDGNRRNTADKDRQNEHANRAKPGQKEQKEQNEENGQNNHRKGRQDKGGSENSRQKPRQEENTPDFTKLPAKPQCPFCLAPYPVEDPAHNAYDNHSICIRCGGATALIRSLDLSSSEDLRRIYRHQYQAGVTLWPRWPKADPIYASLSDLSLAGCAIDCEAALTFDQIILLRTDAINTICQVCYCKETNNTGQYNIGLKFLTLKILASPGSVFSATA